MQTDVWNILDSCAFFSQNHPEGNLATISEIEDELLNRQSKQYFSNLLERGLKLIEPRNQSEKYIKEKAKETGDFDVLSNTDLKILALAYEMKANIVSDDFAIQNISLYLGLNYLSCSKKEIKELRKWKYKCSACNLVNNYKMKSCEVCGSKDIFRIKSR